MAVRIRQNPDELAAKGRALRCGRERHYGKTGWLRKDRKRLAATIIPQTRRLLDIQFRHQSLLQKAFAITDTPTATPRQKPATDAPCKPQPLRARQFLANQNPSALRAATIGRLDTSISLQQAGRRTSAADQHRIVARQQIRLDCLDSRHHRFLARAKTAQIVFAGHERFSSRADQNSVISQLSLSIVRRTRYLATAKADNPTRLQRGIRTRTTGPRGWPTPSLQAGMAEIRHSSQPIDTTTAYEAADNDLETRRDQPISRAGVEAAQGGNIRVPNGSSFAWCVSVVVVLLVIEIGGLPVWRHVDDWRERDCVGLGDALGDIGIDASDLGEDGGGIVDGDLGTIDAKAGDVAALDFGTEGSFHVLLVDGEFAKSLEFPHVIFAGEDG